MSLLRRRAAWILVYTNQRVAEDTQVISSDTDSLVRDVEWNVIHRFNVLLIKNWSKESQVLQYISTCQVETCRPKLDSGAVNWLDIGEMKKFGDVKEIPQHKI
jgi:hypothetical protein